MRERRSQMGLRYRTIMGIPAAHHRLRLVRDLDAPLTRSQRTAQHRQRSLVARETRSAGTAPPLEPTDPRWVLAVRAQAQLQGTMLTPERREQVLRTARLLGVRPFDANLIIAIVQDRARRGEPLGSAAPTLALVSDARRREKPADQSLFRRYGLALLAALSLTALLIWWTLG